MPTPEDRISGMTLHEAHRAFLETIRSIDIQRSVLRSLDTAEMSDKAVAGLYARFAELFDRAAQLAARIEHLKQVV